MNYEKELEKQYTKISLATATIETIKAKISVEINELRKHIDYLRGLIV